MNFLSTVRARAMRALMPRNSAIGNSEQLQRHLDMTGKTTASGAIVTPDSAMRLSTVYSCVKVLSEDISALPLPLFRKLDRGREKVTDHWLSTLLEQPNKWQTGLEFREMQQAHLELCGMFFALKTVLPTGEIAELLPTSPARWTVTLNRNTWEPEFKFTFPNGISSPVPPERVYFVRGLTLDGITGVSPIRYQAEAIGLGMQMVQYGAKLFQNGAMIGGYLSHPSELSDNAAARLKESFEEKYSGVDNSHKVILLEEGAQFNATGMKADEAQFLESRKYSRSEIAGFYRVPLHLINDLERATFSNIEEQSINYVKFGLVPRIRRIEMRMKMQLIPKDLRASMYFSHNVDGLLRGDFEARQRGYQTGVLTGWLTRNQVRELEDLNPGPAELDEYLVPTNMALADNIAANNSNAQQQSTNTPQERLRAI